MTLDTKFQDATAMIRETLSDESARACVTCSFQAECMVIVDLLVAQRPDIPVLFLETGYHFPETYAYRDQMTERLGLNLINLSSKLGVAQQEAQFGILYQSAPDRCCGMRKVEPLFRGLEDYGVWFTALRRESRQHERIFRRLIISSFRVGSSS